MKNIKVQKTLTIKRKTDNKLDFIKIEEFSSRNTFKKNENVTTRRGFGGGSDPGGRSCSLRHSPPCSLHGHWGEQGTHHPLGRTPERCTTTSAPCALRRPRPLSCATRPLLQSLGPRAHTSHPLTADPDGGLDPGGQPDGVPQHLQRPGHT